MHSLLFYLLGQSAFLCSLGLLVPIGYGIYTHSPETPAFLLSLLVSVAVGASLAPSLLTNHSKLSLLEGCSVLIFTWPFLMLFGALPYMIGGELHLMNALLEGISCFTTTGLSSLPPSAPEIFILWRSTCQWLGGMFFLLLIIVVMPQVSNDFGVSFAVEKALHTGQMTIYQMKVTGLKIVRIYAGMSLLLVLIMRLYGADFFDSVNFAMSVISTGGCYQPHLHFGFNSPFLLLLTMAFMIAAAGNFLLYYETWHHRRLSLIFKDTELRYYLGILLIAGCLISWELWHRGGFSPYQAGILGFFHAVSFGTTTGFFADSISTWPAFSKYLLMLLPYVGGCIGGVSGGFKVLRLSILCKSAFGDIQRTLHPHIVVHISMDGVTVSQRVLGSLLVLFFLYFAAFFLGVMVLTSSGMEAPAAMELATGCLTGTGQLVFLEGNITPYLHVNLLAGITCGLLMVLGKIEFFAFLIFIFCLKGASKRSQW